MPSKRKQTIIKKPAGTGNISITIENNLKNTNIAQQIREVIPEAVTIQKAYIPNIMLLADYDNHIVTLPSQPNYIIKQNDKIKC